MADRFRLDGQVALVTGASSGLGVQFARTLASAGASVVLAARRKARLEALASDIAEKGGTAMAVSLDVTDQASIDAALDEIGDRLGTPHVLVNNSGVSREAWLVQMSEEDFDLVMDTNLKGVWRVSKTCANRMIEAGQSGSIINIASITARSSGPMIGAYATSKAAVEHLTRGLALELARYRIRVNAIAPGYFPTELNDGFLDTEPGQAMIRRIPMRRTGELGELSGPLLLLASEAGSFMTGETLVVDGGHLVAAH